MEVKVILKVGFNFLEVDNKKWADELSNYLIIHCKGADLVLHINDETDKIADSIWENIRRDYEKNEGKVFTYIISDQFYKVVVGDDEHLRSFLCVIANQELNEKFRCFFEKEPVKTIQYKTHTIKTEKPDFKISAEKAAKFEKDFASFEPDGFVEYMKGLK